MKLRDLKTELDQLSNDMEIIILDEEGNEYSFTGVLLTQGKIALTYK